MFFDRLTDSLQDSLIHHIFRMPFQPRTRCFRPNLRLPVAILEKLKSTAFHAVPYRTDFIFLWHFVDHDLYFEVIHSLIIIGYQLYTTYSGKTHLFNKYNMWSI